MWNKYLMILRRKLKDQIQKVHRDQNQKFMKFMSDQAPKGYGAVHRCIKPLDIPTLSTSSGEVQSPATSLAKEVACWTKIWHKHILGTKPWQGHGEALLGQCPLPE